MHESFGSSQHNCMVFRHVASVPLKMPGMCQLVLGWSSWEDRGSQGRADVRVCLLCAFITLMAVSFLSLPLSFSFSSPCCRWHTLGALTSQASLSQSWIFAVASFRLCVFPFSSLHVSACWSHCQSHTHHPRWRGPSRRPAKGSPGIQQLPADAAGPSLQGSILREFDSEPAGAWHVGKWCP